MALIKNSPRSVWCSISASRFFASGLMIDAMGFSCGGSGEDYGGKKKCQFGPFFAFCFNLIKAVVGIVEMLRNVLCQLKAVDEYHLRVVTIRRIVEFKHPFDLISRWELLNFDGAIHSLVLHFEHLKSPDSCFSNSAFDTCLSPLPYTHSGPK